MHEMLDAVIEALERGERVALIGAVRSVGSTPRHTAARLTLLASGKTLGTIGGGAMEHRAIADAGTALAKNSPRLVEYNLVGGEGNLGLCGGTQEVFIDILDPDGETVTQWRAIRSALARGEPVVVAQVVRSESGSARVGARQVITFDGAALGSMGDAALAQAALDGARRVMTEHYPARWGFDPATGAAKRLMATRRAPVEIALDLYDPRPRLLVIGAGHIGAALATQGRMLNWRVEIVDDRPEFLLPGNLPDVDAAWLVDYEPEHEQLGPLNVTITPNTAVVVATWGWDLPALRQLAGAPAFYIGLVASLRKAAVLFGALRDEGVDTGWLDQVRVPVGLDVGAESPAEIALAIMAEILALCRGKSGRPLREVRGERVAALFKREDPVHALPTV